MQIVILILALWLLGSLLIMYDQPICRFIDRVSAKYQIRRALQKDSERSLEDVKATTGLSGERIDDVRVELGLDWTKEENQK